MLLEAGSPFLQAKLAQWVEVVPTRCALSVEPDRNESLMVERALTGWAFEFAADRVGMTEKHVRLKWSFPVRNFPHYGFDTAQFSRLSSTNFDWSRHLDGKNHATA